MIGNASNIAPHVDSAMVFISTVSVVLLVFVTFFMVYFAIRFRKAKGLEVREIEGNLGLEIFWTVIPTILVIIMFFYGYTGFKLLWTMPEEALKIKVTGRMWSWTFQYENNQSSDTLVLRLKTPVVLELHSKDVLHSLFIPAFRVKEDAVPGQVTHLWFVPEKPGEYDLFCTEYCGTGHSKMITKAIVMEPEQFDKWYKVSGKKDPAGISRGEAILKEKGCLGCHSLDGSKKIGPSLKGVFNREVTLVVNGQEVQAIADEKYLLRAMLKPKAEVVKGFKPIMPALVTEEEARAISNYLKAAQ